MQGCYLSTDFFYFFNYLHTKEMTNKSPSLWKPLHHFTVSWKHLLAQFSGSRSIRLSTIGQSFPALTPVNRNHTSRAWYQLHVFPRFAKITEIVSDFCGVMWIRTKSRYTLINKLALIKLVFQFHDSTTKKPVVENYYNILKKCWVL